MDKKRQRRFDIKQLRIFLFDLDGTLVLTGGAGVRALESAFKEIFGIHHGMTGIVCDGKTDPAIVREVLSARQLDSSDNISRLLACYVRYLPQEVAQSTAYRLVPGVSETLDYLSRRKGCLCALATGNVEQGARAKLERAGLNHYFTVGGFGSDAESRAEVVRIALLRARAAVGNPDADAIVIGDTPLDVIAAHEAGIQVLGVASGNFNSQALSKAGADWVQGDLSDPQGWISRIERAWLKS